MFTTGTYFNCIMFMVASSVVTTILVLNYHHRQQDTHEMPEWVRNLIVLILIHIAANTPRPQNCIKCNILTSPRPVEKHTAL